jgi:hypothetical protein
MVPWVPPPFRSGSPAIRSLDLPCGHLKKRIQGPRESLESYVGPEGQAGTLALLGSPLSRARRRSSPGALVHIPFPDSHFASCDYNSTSPFVGVLIRHHL